MLQCTIKDPPIAPYPSSCLRILTVGTDISVGHMKTGLELHRASQKQNIKSQFLATGDTDIRLGYDGISVGSLPLGEAVNSVKRSVIEKGRDCDILYIEGQGSLLHPGSTASLVLLRGVQPTHLILTHQSQRTHILDLPTVSIPPLPDVIHLYERIASAGSYVTSVPVLGISLNTSELGYQDAKQAITAVEKTTGLPCTDPIRFNNADYLLNAIL